MATETTTDKMTVYECMAQKIASLQAQADALAKALQSVQNRTRNGPSYRMGSDVDAIATAALAAFGRGRP